MVSGHCQEDQGGETSEEEEERNEASQAFDYPENMSKDEARATYCRKVKHSE